MSVIVLPERLTEVADRVHDLQRQVSDVRDVLDHPKLREVEHDLHTLRVELLLIARAAS